MSGPCTLDFSYWKDHSMDQGNWFFWCSGYSHFPIMDLTPWADAVFVLEVNWRFFDWQGDQPATRVSTWTWKVSSIGHFLCSPDPAWLGGITKNLGSWEDSHGSRIRSIQNIFLIPRVSFLIMATRKYMRYRPGRRKSSKLGPGLREGYMMTDSFCTIFMVSNRSLVRMLFSSREDRSGG